MDYLHQLEMEFPFCSETQPSESALWDEDDLGYTRILSELRQGFLGAGPRVGLYWARFCDKRAELTIAGAMVSALSCATYCFLSSATR